MVTDPPESAYAVLGLIDKVPGSSGYDLVAVAGRSLAFFWPVSQTLLYGELRRLTELGWVKATKVDQTSAPTKWTYEPTKAGRKALTRWLSSITPAATTVRSSVLLRLFFAHRMTPKQVRTVLDQYRRELEDQGVEFEAIVEKLSRDGRPEARSGRVLALHGLATVTAALRWADEAEVALLPEQAP